MNQTILPEPTLLPAPDSPQPATAPDPSDGCLPKRRRRTGKIATLPHALREQTNLLLQDGLPYRAIIEKLHLLSQLRNLAAGPSPGGFHARMISTSYPPAQAGSGVLSESAPIPFAAS